LLQRTRTRQTGETDPLSYTNSNNTQNCLLLLQQEVLLAHHLGLRNIAGDVAIRKVCT